MDVSDLMREIKELRERLDEFPAAPPPLEDSLPPAIIIKDPPLKETVLKPTSFPTYDGDRTTYAAWRRAVLSALRIDWHTFGYTDPRVFLMIYKALEGKAQKRAAAYFESGGVGGRESPEEFIAFLDRGNWDQTRASRARSELNEMKMGQKQKWNQFYSQWANKLTEASGDVWPDDVKVSLLRTALNTTLKVALASNHLVPENNFREFVRIVSKIAQQHEEITRTVSSFQRIGQLKPESDKTNSEFLRNNNERDNSLKEWGMSGKEKGYVGEIDSSGDTYMGGVHSTKVVLGPNGKPLRSKWKTSEQIDKLRREGKCFRCERKGCSTNKCRLLPAKRPKSIVPSVNVADFSEVDPSVYEEDENNSENL